MSTDLQGSRLVSIPSLRGCTGFLGETGGGAATCQLRQGQSQQHIT